MMVSQLEWLKFLIKEDLNPCLRIVFTQEYSMIHGKNLLLFQCTKKVDKQLLENYRPAFLLPILGKNFAKIVFNNISEYL